MFNLQLMSQYNQWINQRIYQIARDLGDENINQDRKAFFGSIFGTLNHIYVADIIWLRRFSEHSQQYQSLQDLPELDSYSNLRAIAVDNIVDLSKLRQELDTIITKWCQEIQPVDLERNLRYNDTKNNPYCKNFGQLVQHFLNHQTHHRGQISTLFSQQGIDIGVTDLLEMIPNISE